MRLCGHTREAGWHEMPLWARARRKRRWVFPCERQTCVWELTNRQDGKAEKWGGKRDI